MIIQKDILLGPSKPSQIERDVFPIRMDWEDGRWPPYLSPSGRVFDARADADSPLVCRVSVLD
jgi:hypothetical protein